MGAVATKYVQTKPTIRINILTARFIGLFSLRAGSLGAETLTGRHYTVRMQVVQPKLLLTGCLISSLSARSDRREGLFSIIFQQDTNILRHPFLREAVAKDEGKGRGGRRRAGLRGVRQTCASCQLSLRGETTRGKGKMEAPGRWYWVGSRLCNHGFRGGRISVRARECSVHHAFKHGY